MALASGWDSGRVFYNNTLGVASEGGNEQESVLRGKCLAFLEHFRIENQFIYRYDRISRSPPAR